MTSILFLRTIQQGEIVSCTFHKVLTRWICFFYSCDLHHGVFEGWYNKKIQQTHRDEGHENKRNKFILSTPYEMYRKQYGEYAYWCWGVRVLRQFIKYYGWSYAVTYSVMKQTWSMYIVPRPFLYYPVNLLLEETLYLWTKILLTVLTVS